MFFSPGTDDSNTGKYQQPLKYKYGNNVDTCSYMKFGLI